MRINYLFIALCISSSAFGIEGEKYEFKNYELQRLSGTWPIEQNAQKTLEYLTKLVNDPKTTAIILNTLMLANAGDKAIHLATCHDFFGKLVRVMLAKGADPNTRDNYGTTPLMLEAQRYPEVSLANIEILLEYDADPSISAENGFTPLHLLCERFLNKDTTYKAIKLLFENGANPLARNRRGKTPAQLIFGDKQRLKNIMEEITSKYTYGKAAYLLLLRGRNHDNPNYNNSPLFKKLPLDIIKIIVDKVCPGRPLPPSTNPAEMLKFLKSEKIEPHAH